MNNLTKEEAFSRLSRSLAATIQYHAGRFEIPVTFDREEGRQEGLLIVWRVVDRYLEEVETFEELERIARRAAKNRFQDCMSFMRSARRDIARETDAEIYEDTRVCEPEWEGNLHLWELESGLDPEARQLLDVLLGQLPKVSLNAAARELGWTQKKARVVKARIREQAELVFDIADKKTA